MRLRAVRAAGKPARAAVRQSRPCPWPGGPAAEPADRPMGPVLRAFAVLAAIAGAIFAAPAPAATQGAAKPPVAAAAKARPRTVPAAAARALEPADVPLTPAQLDLSGLVLLGDVDCDMRQRVSLWPIATRPGYFELRFGKAVYTLVPHETASGAVRLEDAKAGVVWLQIPVKSMLLDTRRGLRLADGCMHSAQRHEQADAASAPTAAAGLGITELQR